MRGRGRKRLPEGHERLCAQPAERSYRRGDDLLGERLHVMLKLRHALLGHVAAGAPYGDGQRRRVVFGFRVRRPHPRRPLEPSIHVLAQEPLELLSERDQLRVCRCRRRKLAHCRAVLSLGRPACAGRSIPVPAGDLFLFSATLPSSRRPDSANLNYHFAVLGPCAAVQGKLADQAVARRCRLRSLPALLTGRLFDHRGNRMSPTHANKGGVRYRYYISQAVLQKKPHAPGSVSRVPAAELEALVLAALRKHLTISGAGQPLPGHDRGLCERHLERVTLTANHVALRFRHIVEQAQELDAHDGATASSQPAMTTIKTIAIPWSS